MDKLYEQVRQAQRRLNLQRFVSLLPLCWFGTLMAAAIAIVVHKRFPTGADPWVWNAGWLAGAMVAGMLAAAIWTYVTRQASLEAAIEIDHRFGLKERVSSSLALTPDERESEAGRAVIEDAARRVERLDVSDRFGVSLGRRILLPAAPALLAFLAALLLSEKGIDKPVVATTSTVAQKKQVKKSTDELRKKIEQRRKELSEKGLKDAEDALKEVDNGLRDLDKKTDGDRKQALVKLNNLADKLQEERKKLGGSDEMRKQLNKLKDLNKGPADKMASAMKDGDFKKALGEIDKLKQQLRDGKMGAEDQKKLADQLDQMKQKLQEVADAHRQAMEDLKQQVKEARDSGDVAGADKLQQALDRLAQQIPQMDKMQKLADKMGAASKAVKQGQSDKASQSLDQLSSELDQMQSDLDQLEALETTLDEIQQAKNAMKCDQCGGDGCKACGGGDGMGQGGGKGKGGDGLGAAKGGRGARPENENKTKTYDSRVKGKVGPGQAVVTGQADGPNAKGNVRDAIQSEFENRSAKQADPLTGQRLPKSHQRHVEEYFESLREGN